MKRYSLLAVLAFLFTVSASAQLLTEDFAYTAGTFLTDNGWSQTGTGTTVPVAVSTGGLTFTGYVNSGIGNAALVNNTGQDVNKPFAAQSSGTVYASFMVKVDNYLTSGTSNYFLHFTENSTSTNFRAKLFAQRTGTSTNFELGLSDGSNTATFTTNSYVLGNVYVVVLKHDIVVGTNNDAVSLYVFDTSIPATEPTSATIGPLTDAAVTDLADIDRICFRQFNASQNVTVDGIRVATSWSLAPLPVELTSFNSVVRGRNIELNWKTASEVNNYGFEIERKSINNWQKVGFVEGNGTTNAPQAYSFTDNAVSAGAHSYRLKQIDRDGKFEYSKVVEATIGLTPNTVFLGQNYPNPFNPETNIEFAIPVSGRTTLKVYSMLGQEVATLVNGNVEAGVIQHASFKGTSLPSGLYFYTLRSGSFVDTKKMMMMK